MQKEIHLNETEWKKFTNVEKKKIGKSFFYAFFYTRHLVIKDLYIGGTKVFRDVGKQICLR